MNKNIIKNKKRNRHKVKIRTKISGTAEIPRLSVFRSSKRMYLQIIDDTQNKTIVSADSSEIKENSKKKDENSKIRIAFKSGKLIAEKAIEKKIKQVIFDRGGYKYHGRVKAVAEGAREGGLKF